ncbi:ArsR/SmtB family transcription factor [Vibrio sp. 10N.247.311.14]|uniref:ArsR/SmtB family transcription factor n=1 Tax=unclassified Vibrio TaxID=2614977 RepID=UPI000CA90209|nr:MULTISPECIES: metalloregulator ArsR/SmtB family transcription factor [unclassified Vibrio]PMK26558.1 transcriptional regulator [Vibrio sp. 10N.261.54.C3]TKF36810.1 helix-turn-helix transcriptional regulator [Vibrio sp. F13]TKF66857.1 helix-turn-helix transcriptional regulator [Vibrio sp. F13]
MNLEVVAKALKELGHPIRLTIYKSVVKAGYQGIAVGGLQEELGIPGSTLSHHISSLASAGLISQRREGRTLFCVAKYECLEGVIDFLQDECCVNEQCN